MEVIFNERIEIHKWGEFIEENPFSSPFQTPSFYQFINSLDNHSAEVVAVLDNQKNIKALTVVAIHSEKGIKKYFSKRGIIYGGPLFNDLDSATKLLLSLRKYFKNKVIYLEIRNNKSFEEYQSIFYQFKWTYIPYQNYILDIKDSDQFFSDFTSEKRRQIRKAIKNNTTWSVCNNREEVKEIYDMMHYLYKSKIKKPLPDLYFFLRMHNMFIKQRNGVVLVIKKGENIIGGCFCPIHKDTIYDWYRVGLDKEYKHSFPSTFAAYAGMQYGSEHGLHTFDFMGAGIRGENYGVKKFKSQFGGQLVEHGRYLMVTNPLLYKIGKLGLSILQRIK